MLHSRFIISGLALMGLLGAAWAQFTLGPDPVPWGWNEAVPVHGDYDGDGRIDAAVYWPQGQLGTSCPFNLDSLGSNWVG
jgi:hypothetical protein